MAALAIAAHTYVIHYVVGFDWSLALTAAITSTTEISLGVWVTVLLIRSYPTKVSIYPYAIVVALLVAGAVAFFDWQMVRWMTRGWADQPNIIYWFSHSLPVRFFVMWIFYSLIATNAALRRNIVELNTRFQEHRDASVLHREAELFKLRQQLQPHFLYNSLNSISALVMISPDRAQEMIGRLSDFLRDSVKRESEEIMDIADEIVYIESYLAIESVRFGDRLRVQIHKNYKVGSRIPPFLFQPLLENAIKFGLYGKTGMVDIVIDIRSEDDALVLKIVNPYDQLHVVNGGSGFGLKGVGRRLFLLFGRNDLLESFGKDGIYTTILKIPQHVQSIVD